MTKSELFIQKYKKVLETGPDFFARDAALMRPEEYKKRKYSFLLIAPSPALTKSVSATFAVINDMFCSEMDDWFFDIAYLPTKKDLDLYDKNNVPYCIGQISHLDASHFTMVGFSISVLHEVLTAPVIMKSWSRCDKPIPLSWTERKDTKFGEHPLILAGGITAAHGEIMFGELGDGRKSFLDFLVLGICDNLKMIGETLDKECTPEMTNQEVIESFFKYEFVYQPQAYRKVYKDNLIVENTKINPKARDFVKPYYPKFIPPRLGVGRTIIQPTGTNAGDTQIQLSEGALIKGSLVATQRGLVPIEEVTVEDSAWSLKGLHPVIQTWSLGVMQCVKLKTKGGVELTATLNHPVYQYDPINGESFVHAGKLQVGDCLVCIDYLTLPEPSQVITDYLQEIVSVEYTEAEVYDLTVYGSHRYNANSVEVHNCTGGRGNCFFSVTGNMTIITDIGEMPISEAYVKQKEIYKIRGEKVLEKFDRIARLGLEDVWFVRTSNNFALECSEHHKWVHMVDGEFVECETHELKTGMRVFTYTEADGYTPTKIRSVRKLNRKSVMYDVVNTETHLCVYNGILTHQCAESNYSGSWQEAPLAQIKRHALETKKWSAATSCKPLSFNALPDYTLIPTGGKFKRLSEISEDDKLINTRTDEAGIVGIAIAQPKEHLRFRLDRGPAAVMSKDHRQVIATSEGLKTVQANEIKVGDYIPYLVGYYKDQDLEFSEKHFLAGLWYGDGYLSGRNKRAYQAVACHESELAKFVANSEFVDREVTTREGIRHFLYTEEFGEFVKYLFPDYKYADNNLTSLTVSEAVSFIRGWFNADGSVSYRNSVLDVHLTGSAKELQVLEWASTVLMSVGINNRISAPVHVSLSGYDKIHVRYDLYVRTRASERLVWGWFVEPLKNARVSMALRDEKRSSSDLIPPFVGKWMSKNYPRVSGANDYNFWSGLKAMSVERMEGKYASLGGGYLDMIRNGWRFAKVEEIIDEGVLPCRDVLESDDHMYLTGFGLTHNCNHVEDFTEVIYALNEAFPKVTYINMRLEELAQDPEAFKMMRYTGASRLSAPIEGLSNRIRNGFMNKNLSQESIESLLRFLVGQRVTDIKVGLVWSGFENEDDWNEMRALVSKLKAEAASLNRKLPFRLKACLTREALTPVPGKGLLRQDKLSVGPVVGWKDDDIIATQPQGDSEVWEVVTSLGQVIRGTKNHPLLTDWNGKKATDGCYTALSALKEGQWLYGRIGTNIYGDYQKFVTEGSRQEPPREILLDESLAALFGWYMGDGFIESGDMKAFGCCFSLQEQALSQKLADVMTKLGYNVCSHNQGDKKMTAWRVHSASFVRALNREFGHSAYGKKISDLILQSPKSVQTEFLKYWFTADGTVVAQPGYNSRVKLYSVNRQVLLDAQTMLMNMGILSVVSGHKVKCGEKDFYTYQLEVRSCSIAAFKEIVGFEGAKQDKVIVNNTRSSHTLKANGFYRCRVKSVRQVENAETFGLQVAETSSYLTNGIVSHNTPLVYYPGTPLEVAERVTSRISYEGKRYFNDEMYEKNKEAGIHIKINGFRGSTFIEQAIVDLGEQLTPWVYQHLVVPGTVCFNTRPVATDENFPSFKAIITAPDKYFAARNLDSYISPFHRIRLDLEGGIIEGQRRIETDPFNEHPTGKCLFTYEGCKTKCFHNVMKKRPYKHYYDVKLVDGKLVGDKYDLIEGCNSCESTEEMTTKHLRRKWAHKYSVDDLQAQVVTRTQKKYRLILKRLEEYSIVSPHSTAFTTMACLLRKSDKLLETYWNLVDHSLATQMSPDVVYDIKGYQIVDCIFKEEVIDELKKAIPLANQEMMTAQICGVYEIPLHEKLKTDDINVYKFEMDGGSLESFINCKASYNGGVRVLSSVDMQPKVVRQVDKELRYPLFKKKGNKVVGIFALPRKYNPYLFFQEVLSDKKYTQKQIQLCTTFEVVAVFQKDSFTHCSCGNNTVRSALTGKSMGRCEHCITKVLMSKL